MRRAVQMALGGHSTTKVAEEFGIPARTLRRYVANEKRRSMGGITDDGLRLDGGPRLSQGNRTSANSTCSKCKNVFDP